MQTNDLAIITATGTLEEVVTRQGYDESALFVHVRYPDTVQKLILTCPTERVLDDDLYPGTDITLELTSCGLAEYIAPFRHPEPSPMVIP